MNGIPANTAWRKVTWSDDLKIFCACGSNSAAGSSKIMTSPNGISWTGRGTPMADSMLLYDVAWSPDLGLFCAVGSYQTIITSVDGMTWTLRRGPVSANLFGVTWSSSLGLFCSVGSSGLVCTSPDGIIWTQRTAPSSYDWQRVTWSAEKGLFVAVAGTGTATGRAMTSPDGINWTTRPLNVGMIWTSVTWSPSLNMFIAVASSGTSRVARSTDGISWNISTIGNNDVQWYDVTWNNYLNIFVAVGRSQTTTADRKQVMISSDGVNWTLSNAISDSWWSGITWSSELKRFVSVAQDGTTRAMISTDGLTWLIDIPVAVTGVTISPKTKTLMVNETQQLAATVSPPDASNQNVSYISSASAVASVNSTGLVRGVSEGTAEITVTTEEGNFTDISYITVGTPVKPVTGVTLSPSSFTITAGSTRQLTATISPSDATNKGVSFKSSNTNIAIVSNTGLVTGISSGTSVITATTDEGGFTATSQATINAVVIPVSGVTLEPGTASIKVGETVKLTETVVPTNATNKTVVFHSSNTAIATVSEIGVVTGIAVGSAQISVNTNDGNFSDYSDITVVTPIVPVSSVSLNPSVAAVSIGESLRLTATINPSNATNRNITYSSDNAAVATVDQAGLVTGIGDGQTQIRVRTEDGNFSASSTISVTSTPPPKEGNEFLPFAISPQANTVPQTQYGTLYERTEGNPSTGIPSSALVNKATRQTSNMGAAIGEFIRRQGLDVEDNGDIALLAYKFEQAIRILIYQNGGMF